MPQRFLPHLAKPMVPLGKDGSSEMLLDFLVCMLREMPPGLVEKIYLVHVISDDALKKALGRDLRLEALRANILPMWWGAFLRRRPTAGTRDFWYVLMGPLMPVRP